VTVEGLGRGGILVRSAQQRRALAHREVHAPGHVALARVCARHSPARQARTPPRYATTTTGAGAPRQAGDLPDVDACSPLNGPGAQWWDHGGYYFYHQNPWKTNLSQQ
jgi:hypothetical protein